MKKHMRFLSLLLGLSMLAGLMFSTSSIPLVAAAPITNEIIPFAPFVPTDEELRWGTGDQDIIPDVPGLVASVINDTAYLDNLSFFPDINDREFWDGLPASLKTQIMNSGNTAINTTWNIIKSSDYQVYNRTGNRTTYESTHQFPRRYAVNRMVLAECVENQGRFIPQIIDGLFAIMEESTWALPPHNVYIRDTPTYSFPDYDRPVLDLFAGQTASVLSMTDYLLGSRLDDISTLIRKDINHMLKERIFEPFMNFHFWWKGGYGPMLNWTPWIVQNVMLSAFTRPDSVLSKEEKTAIMKGCANSLDWFLNEYEEDGCCSEGPGYYTNAALTLYNCLDLLERVTGGEGESGISDVFGTTKIYNMAEYICRVRVSASGTSYLNFSDASASGGRRGFREYLFGKRVGSEWLSNMAAGDYSGTIAVSEQNLYHRVLEVMTWEEITGITASPFPTVDSWFPSQDMLVARDADLLLAAKGGTNKDPGHNHNDVGSFIIYKGGVLMFGDMGVGTYTADTFNPWTRYKIGTMQSQYHNLPTFEGYMQHADEVDDQPAVYKAKNVQHEMSAPDDPNPVDPWVSFDISDAYKKLNTATGVRDVGVRQPGGIGADLEEVPGAVGGLESYVRKAQLLKNNKIVITDTYVGDLKATLSLMVRVNPVITDNGGGNWTISLGAQLGIFTLSGASQVTRETVPATVGVSGYYRILADLDGSGVLTLEIPSAAASGTTTLPGIDTASATLPELDLEAMLSDASWEEAAYYGAIGSFPVVAEGEGNVPTAPFMPIAAASGPITNEIIPFAPFVPTDEELRWGTGDQDIIPDIAGLVASVINDSIYMDNLSFFPDINDREFWDGLPASLKTQIMNSGNTAINTTWNIIKSSDYQVYNRTGNRTTYESTHQFPRRYAVNRMVLAECVENQGRFIPQIIDGLFAIMEESTWALPPHNVYIRDTPTYSFPDYDRPVLDLFAGQTASVLSMTDYLLGSRLDEISTLIRKDINFKLKERIFEPFMNFHFWWKGGYGPMLNWTPWIVQNVMLSAFTRPDSALSKAEKTALMKGCANSLDWFLNEYWEDGCCSEGPGYYTNAALTLYNCLDLLERVTGGEGESGITDLFGNKKIFNMAEYICRVRVSASGTSYLNFSDASASGGRRGFREYLFGKRVGSEWLSNMAVGDYTGTIAVSEQNLYHRVLEVMTWEEITGLTAGPSPTIDSWFPSQDMLVARDIDLLLAAKGGSNKDAGHNHNDVGSFIIYKGGVLMFGDMGVGTYTADTFNPWTRYKIGTMQSQYHNLPTFEGYMQHADEVDDQPAVYKAKDVQHEMSEPGDPNPVDPWVSFDISDAYKKLDPVTGVRDVGVRQPGGIGADLEEVPGAVSGIESYVRKAQLFKNDKIVITDTYVGDLKATLSLMVRVNPVITDNGGGNWSISLGAQLGTFTLSGASQVTRETVPATVGVSGYYRILADLDGSGVLTLEIPSALGDLAAAIAAFEAICAVHAPNYFTIGTWTPAEAAYQTAVSVFNREDATVAQINAAAAALRAATAALKEHVFDLGSQPVSVVIRKGMSYQIKIESESPDTIFYVSSNANATVDATGLVKAVKTGSAVITVIDAYAQKYYTVAINITS